MTKAGKRLLQFGDGTGTDYHDAYCNALIGGDCSCGLPAAVAAIEAEAVAARNAEIAAAVEAYRLIEPNEPDYPGPYYDGWHAALDAVLTIVEGTP